MVHWDNGAKVSEQMQPQQSETGDLFSASEVPAIVTSCMVDPAETTTGSSSVRGTANSLN